MSLENNENLKNININENNIQNNNEASIKIKNLLKKLLQDTLGTPLTKLEKKNSIDTSNLKTISQNFDEFTKKINFFQKKVEETLKKKEKEKNKKIKNDKFIKTNNNNKKRTLSSNSIKITFNKKRNQTTLTGEEMEKNNISKNINTVERGKTTRSNKIKLRTISNFKNITNSQKERSNNREIKIESYKDQKTMKSKERTNLKKYKTSINKNSFIKEINKNENENSLFINLNKINNNKKSDINIPSKQNSSAKGNKYKKGMNYSYDKTDGNTLSDIEEKIEKKIIDNNTITRKNKFKDKEEKKYVLISKTKLENKFDKKVNSNININKKKQNIINNDNIIIKKDIALENNNNSNTLSTDLDIKYSKSNKSNNIKNINKALTQVPIEKKEDSQKTTIENIQKMVYDVNQSINKIISLDGSQSNFQRRSSIREVSRSFIINKNNEIKEFLNKSPENKNKNEKEKDNIKDYNDIPKSNSNLNKNLNLKCKIDYNVLSNDMINKKSTRKIKINNDISNINNLTSSAINKKNIIKEKEIKNYNSYRNNNIINNKNTIKKIILKSNKYQIKDSEKNKKNKIGDYIGDKINSFKEEEEEEKEKEKEKKITFNNIIQNNPKILSTILQYLSFKNKIYFLSINKFLSKERINILTNKREELILILQLNENETIDDKIKKLKNNSNNNKKENLLKEFKLTKECTKNLKKLNDSQNIKLFKENQINNNKITEINIIYRILLLLFGEKNLVEISDDNLFWKKCCKYLNEKSNEGKIGNFIINQAGNFCFDHQTINLIESIIIGNKNNILNGYYEKLCKTTGLIIPLIKEALSYCGIIIDIKNNSNKILENLQYNKLLIHKLDNIISSSFNK